MGKFRLTIDGGTIRDPTGREVTIRGINVAGDSKQPYTPDLPSHISDGFFEGDSVSFVGRPFPVEEAPLHFARLKRWGYNTLRYLFTWEAIEHAGPGIYDEDWMQHTVAVLRLAKDFGFHVFMDPHQDVWSRFSGGSGAPMWTLYACGLNPRSFAATEAALVQNQWPDPAAFPKMIWSTNYNRMACQVIFTIFFAGRDFAPKAIIDGLNIQDYLQGHFFAACKHLAQRLHEAGDLEDDVVFGWESFNEPNRGMIGLPDLTAIPSDQKLQKGTSPTAWQAILTGSGRACEIETWEFGRLGPYRSGSILVDPQGESAWLATDEYDRRYGWKRDPGWKLGECIWAQHGVWDPSQDTLLKKNYFANHPKTGEKLTYEIFTNTYFMDFYRRYRDAIRSVHHHAIMFCQPPVLELPPSLKGTADDDSQMIYAPHFYDGVTLMTKSWNRYWNIDVFGLLRGRYSSPVFAIKIGETAIRNCLRDQLAAIRQEGLDHMGEHPCVFTEIGIPFDLNDRHAYKTGDYSSQCMAMDANHFAIEGSGANGFSLWVYMSKNVHQWGDHWNGEDLSIFSVDDKTLALTQSRLLSANDSTSTLTALPSSDKTPQPAFTTVTPSNLHDKLATPSMTSSDTASGLAEPPIKPGHRAAEAFIRPSPVFTTGALQSHGFDLRTCTFTLTLSATRPTEQDAPTEVILPEYHFPAHATDVDVSGGKWSVSLDSIEDVQVQKLRWWHGHGEQTLTVKGLVRRIGRTTEPEQDEGYLAQIWETCVVM
ncbi:MAG: hypothetical protein M1826_007712 [Phylliscum demangeonii]|nr:MAG: hypothetical protein M1826_007712 [Phylliscum demangeonii]